MLLAPGAVPSGQKRQGKEGREGERGTRLKERSGKRRGQGVRGVAYSPAQGVQGGESHPLIDPRSGRGSLALPWAFRGAG